MRTASKLLFGDMQSALSSQLCETGYALACEMAAADGVLTDEEMQVLELVRHRLEHRPPDRGWHRAGRPRTVRGGLSLPNMFPRSLGSIDIECLSTPWPESGWLITLHASTALLSLVMGVLIFRAAQGHADSSRALGYTWIARDGGGCACRRCS